MNVEEFTSENILASGVQRIHTLQKRILDTLRYE